MWKRVNMSRKGYSHMPNKQGRGPNRQGGQEKFQNLINGGLEFEKGFK